MSAAGVWGGRLSRLGLGMAAALLVAEAAARVLPLRGRWLPDLCYWQGADAELHRWSADPLLLYELRPGASRSYPGVETWGDNPRVIRINSLGFRDPERSAAKPPHTFRIVALGGSNTYGAAVSDGRTWPAFLEAELRARTGRSIEVWNAGVSAYSSAQAIHNARRILSSFDPDLLLFQLHNVGGRNIPRTADADVSDLFRRDPSLWDEHLLWVPARGTLPRTIFERSALWQAGAMATNRGYRSFLPGGQRLWAIDGIQEERAARAYETLVVELGDRVPAVLFIPPSGPGAGWINGRHYRAVDLYPKNEAERRARLPDRIDIAEIHPGAEVYRWYAARLADALLAGRCVERVAGLVPCVLPRT
jgi:hypothetical protein